MRYLILMSVLTLTACVTSPVVPLDENGNYLVSIHTFYGLTSARAMRDRAAGAADDYCELSGKTAHIKQAIGTGVPGLTNLSGNVVFTCITPETLGDWN